MWVTFRGFAEASKGPFGFLLRALKSLGFGVKGLGK